MNDHILERSFSRMVDKVSDYAVFLIDVNGVIKTWNPAAEVMKGFSSSEAIGRPLSILYTEEDQRRHHPEHNLKDASDNGTFQESGWRKRKDGSLFWALVEIIAIRSDDGQLDGFCKVTRDLTNMKRLQEELATEKERAELTLDAIADGVISIDSAGQIEYVNHQAQQFLGWSQEEVKGRRVGEVFDIVHSAEYSAEEADLAQAEASDRPPRATQVLRARDGARHMIEARYSEFPGREGVAGGRVIAFHDVSGRQLMEAALRDADRRKDEFLAMLAHELRNPLAPVSVAAELLSLGKLDGESARKASQVIIRQVKHMTELVDDLLDVSRVSRGQITLKMAPLDMKVVVASAIEQARPLIESRQHALGIKLPAAKTHVRGDEKRLVQVVANLLNNAAKYTPLEGSLDLELSIVNGDVCVDVVDNGIGIEADMQKIVFGLFEQARHTSDRTLGGLGIGLALVHSLTVLHGGTVTCQSAGLGQGSRFTLRIPRLAAGGAVPERRSVERAVELPVGHPPLSVLIVDDNIDAADMLQFFLTTMGHQVRLAHTASATLEALKLSTPDVCILDIGLPDSSGHELASRIRAALPAPPVLIALTGYSTARDRDQASEAGFDHYFVKPADLDELCAVLAGVTPRKASA